MVDLEKIERKKTVQELLEFGIINIDKPSGPTSFDVSDFVRKTLKSLGVRKTSHFGTLDPGVTGVLPIALNRACKLTGFFMMGDKEYIGVMRTHKDVQIKNIERIIKEKFIGEIIQLPPKKSRVKRQERQREVKKFELLEKEEKDILFYVKVERGTYIRKLIHDLGQEIEGAHMLELRRIKAGIFEENDKYSPSITLYDFEKAVEEYRNGNEKRLKEIIIPAEIISKLFPVIEIKEDSVDRILHGQPVYNKNLVKKYDLEKEQVVSVFCKDKFVGMFKIINGKDIFAKSEFVMQEMR